MKKLSVIIPTYNVERYIRYTLKTLLSNHEKAFEVIVVDDGSTDNTVKVIEDIMVGNTNIEFKLIKKRNGGVSSARNRGLAEASGKYVMFLDGDDYVTSHLISRIYCGINSQEQEVDIICWDHKRVSDYAQTIIDKSSCEFELLTGLDVFRNMLVKKNMIIFMGTAAYKKCFLTDNKLQFTEGCMSGEDTEFVCKALSHARRVLYTRDILTYYVQRQGSFTNSYNIRRFDNVYAVKRLETYFDKNSGFWEIYLRNRDTQIIGSYLRHFHSCLNCLTKSLIPSKKNVEKLLYEIEKFYPGLNKEIMAMMNRYSRKDKTWIKGRAFLISPVLYGFLINFWRVLMRKNHRCF